MRRSVPLHLLNIQLTLLPSSGRAAIARPTVVISFSIHIDFAAGGDDKVAAYIEDKRCASIFALTACVNVPLAPMVHVLLMRNFQG